MTRPESKLNQRGVKTDRVELGGDYREIWYENNLYHSNKGEKKHKKDSLMSLNFLFINSLYSFKHDYSTSDNFYLLQSHGYIYLQLPL